MKNFTRILAVVLCIVVSLSLAACNLVGVDEEKDKNQAVAVVNGVEISKQEFLNMQQQYLYIYQMFGYDPTSTEEGLAEFNSNILESMITQEVLTQKAKELGFMELSEEDQAEVDAEFKEAYDSYKEDFREQAESEKLNDDTVDVEARIDELARAELEANGQSYDEIQQEYVVSKAIENLQKSINDSVSITEDEARAWYQETLDAQTTEIQSDSTAYENYANGSSSALALYIPDGYRYVKQILISFEENEELESQMDELETRISEIDTEVASLKEEDETANASKIEELNTEKTGKQTELGKLQEQYKASAKAKAQEVLDKLAAGEDFDALVAEYNEDPGVAEGGAYAETGYLVGPETTSYVAPFTAAALALQNIGDVSDMVETDFGYHILKLATLVESRTVAFEEVKDAATEAALAEKQEEEWYAKMDEWTAAAKITRYEDRLVDESDNYVD